MAKRGPKPEPAAVKRAKGNPGRRPIGDEPEAAPAKETAAAEAAAPVISSSLTAPEWLVGGGLVIWQRLAPRLAAMRLISDTDYETFGRYCRNFDRWLRMQAILDREGETYETRTYLAGAASNDSDGETDDRPARLDVMKRIHPAFAIADRIEKQLVAIEDRFGLSPAERQRLYAARASAGAGDPGDLFRRPAGRDPSDSPPAEPSKPASSAGESAIGLLN